MKPIKILKKLNESYDNLDKYIDNIFSNLKVGDTLKVKQLDGNLVDSKVIRLDSKNEIILVKYPKKELYGIVSFSCANGKCVSDVLSWKSKKYANKHFDELFELRDNTSIADVDEEYVAWSDFNANNENEYFDNAEDAIKYAKENDLDAVVHIDYTNGGYEETIWLKDGDDEDDSDESLNENWYHFTFEDGSNPYISKTEEDRDWMLNHYKGRVKETSPGYYYVLKEEIDTSMNGDMSRGINYKSPRIAIIYQIQDIENCKYAFMNWDYAEDKFNMDDYKEVATIEVPESNNELEQIYMLGNTAKDRFKTNGTNFRSISVSDVIEIDGKKYYVNDLGFKEIK